MEAGHKKNVIFGNYCVCVWRMEGKCEDWVLVEKGGGKNVDGGKGRWKKCR